MSDVRRFGRTAGLWMWWSLLVMLLPPTPVSAELEPALAPGSEAPSEELQPAWAAWAEIELYARAGKTRHKLSSDEVVPSWLPLEIAVTCDGFRDPLEVWVEVRPLNFDRELLSVYDPFFWKGTVFRDARRGELQKNSWYEISVQCWSGDYLALTQSLTFYTSEPDVWVQARQEQLENGRYKVSVEGGIERWALRYVEKSELSVWTEDLDPHKPNIKVPAEVGEHGQVKASLDSARAVILKLEYDLVGDKIASGVFTFPWIDEPVDPNAPKGGGSDLPDPPFLMAPGPDSGEGPAAEPSYDSEELPEDTFDVGAPGDYEPIGEELLSPPEEMPLPDEMPLPEEIAAPEEMPLPEEFLLPGPDYLDPLLPSEPSLPDEAWYLDDAMMMPPADDYSDLDGDGYLDSYDPEPWDPCLPDPMLCGFDPYAGENPWAF